MTSITEKKQDSAVILANPLEALRSMIAEESMERKYNEDEKHLAQAIGYIMRFDYDKAENIIEKLYERTQNDSLKKYCQMIYYDLLFFQSKWKELCIFDSTYNTKNEDNDNIMVLGKAFRLSSPESVVWDKDTTSVDFTESPTGCPIIPCLINGNLKYFWFDTGANYSVLSAQTADECGIQPTIRQYSKALTGTSRKIDIYPTIINELKIADLTINNSPAVIVHDFDLKMKFFGSFRSTKIDGIIGWKAIQHMSLKIDFLKHILQISKPIKREIPESGKNYFWLGCPVIKLRSDKGIPLIMAIDFGSEKTSLTQNIFKKISFEKIFQQVQSQTSAGGSVYFNSNMVAKLGCIIDGRSYDFNNIGTTFQVPLLFINIDGIIGMDLFRESIISMDLINGEFKIIQD